MCILLAKGSIFVWTYIPLFFWKLLKYLNCYSIKENNYGNPTFTTRLLRFVARITQLIYYILIWNTNLCCSISDVRRKQSNLPWETELKEAGGRGGVSKGFGLDFRGATPDFGDIKPDFGDAKPNFTGAKPDFLGTIPDFWGATPEILRCHIIFLKCNTRFLRCHTKFLRVHTWFLRCHTRILCC